MNTTWKIPRGASPTTPDVSELVKDPLFQLNAVIWLAQSLPESSSIHPGFHRLGFSVYAIAPPLSLPLDLRLHAQRLDVPLNASVKPDVVLESSTDRRFAFVECKANSFSVQSSSVNQLRTYLLLSGGQAADALGLAPGQVSDSILSLVTAEESRLRLQDTTRETAEALASKGLSPGPFSVMGFETSEEGVFLCIGPQAQAFFGFTDGRYKFLDVASGTDPRPLYFIPYDPDLNMTGEERAFGRRVLFERMLAAVISAVGRAEPPRAVTFALRDLLNDACFGIFNKWENDSSRRHMFSITRNFLRALEKSTRISPSPFGLESDMWSVTLADEDQKERVLDRITRFTAESVSKEIGAVTLSDYPLSQD